MIKNDKQKVVKNFLCYCALIITPCTSIFRDLGVERFQIVN